LVLQQQLLSATTAPRTVSPSQATFAPSNRIALVIALEPCLAHRPAVQCATRLRARLRVAFAVQCATRLRDSPARPPSSRLCRSARDSPSSLCARLRVNPPFGARLAVCACASRSPTRLLRGKRQENTTTNNNGDAQL